MITVKKLKPVDPSLFLGAKLIIAVYEETLRLKVRPCNLTVKGYAELFKMASSSHADMKEELTLRFRYAVYSFGRRSSEQTEARMRELAARFVDDNRELFAELEILHGGVKEVSL